MPVYYMGIRTVRLDEPSERILADIRRRTGLSVSAALKEGLAAARVALDSRGANRPFDVYATIDLGPGGYARIPARRAKAGVRGALRRKHRR